MYYIEYVPLLYHMIIFFSQGFLGHIDLDSMSTNSSMRMFTPGRWHATLKTTGILIPTAGLNIHQSRLLEWIFTNYNCWTEFSPTEIARVTIHQLQLLDWIIINYNSGTEYSPITTAGLGIHQLQLRDWIFANYNCDFKEGRLILVRSIAATGWKICSRYHKDIKQITHR